MKFVRFIYLLVILVGIQDQINAQYKFHTPDKHDLSGVRYSQTANNGFVLSASIVAMFTAGVEDRKGFRIGGGFSVGYQVGDWTLATGLDVYKAKESLNFGTSYAGVKYRDKYGYGASYYLNRYHQGDKQTSAIVAVELDEFQVRFEDDILALPFTGFKIYDRFRTAALELQYRHVLVGTNVYTTDISGVLDVSFNNCKGAYRDGVQVSSPIYVGYSNWGMIARYGINSKLGGIAGQNSWHRRLFGTPDFKEGDYKNHFFQIGVDKPYTLY